jgi:hypothetical protein
MNAPLGDDVFKDDPTVNLLEQKVITTHQQSNLKVKF